MDYKEMERQVYKEVLTGRISREAREPLEGLAFLVLFVVGILSGMLLEQRWSAIERRQDAYEARQKLVDARLKKVDDVMFGAIE